MASVVVLLLLVIVLAIIFDFINGFHDAANAIATVVATGVLPLRTAAFLAGVFNIIGALMGTGVAKTIAKGFADPATVTQSVVLAALLGACVWNLITWWKGIPSSSSHALIGALAGAVVTHAGWAAFSWKALLLKVIVPLIASPITGFLISFFVMIGLMWGVRGMPTGRVNRLARCFQLFSALAMAFSHGSNDAQKSMGIITLALRSFMAMGVTSLPVWIFPRTSDEVPQWVILACALAIGSGTMSGGKKIIETMGSKIFRVEPIHGFAAETAGTLTILAASHAGMPISTTHCINACLAGVGSTKRLSAVRWSVTRNIVYAWFLTLPASALMAALTMALLDFLRIG